MEQNLIHIETGKFYNSYGEHFSLVNNSNEIVTEDMVDNIDDIFVSMFYRESYMCDYKVILSLADSDDKRKVEKLLTDLDERYTDMIDNKKVYRLNDNHFKLHPSTNNILHIHLDNYEDVLNLKVCLIKKLKIEFNLYTTISDPKISLVK